MNKTKEINLQKTFSASEEWMAYHDAVKWCEDNGYSVGEMCSPMPIAIIKGDFWIGKWKNLTMKQRDAVDGVIESNGIHGGFRSGPIKVTIFKST